MSERAKFDPEAFELHEVGRELPEHAGESVNTKLEVTPDRSEAPTNHAENISSIRAEVEQNAAETAAVSLQEQTPAAATQHQGPVNKALQGLTADRSLSHIRHNLSAPDKALSKLIHKPAVRATSELGARTVGRPLALLVGGLCALIGSSIYLYLARHIGFSYNYLVSTMLFTGGLVLGLLLEAIWRLVSGGKKPHHL